MAASTFKLGLPYDPELRESLTMQPPENMHQLITCIEEHKRLKGDRLQNRGKVPTTFHDRREARVGGF